MRLQVRSKGGKLIHQLRKPTNYKRDCKKLVRWQRS